MKLSVVIPTHDVAPWVTDSLASILRQEVDLEVLVIDDHSEDDTVALVDSIAGRDPRVQLHRATSTGGASARNLGIELARGEYVAFADGDDLVPDGAYAALIAAADEHGVELAIGRHLKFSSGATWEPMTPWYDTSTARLTNLQETPALLANRACWNRLYRRDFLIAEGVRFPEVARSNDIVPMVKLLRLAPEIAIVPRVVYLYRQRPGVSSMTARSSSSAGVLSYLEQEIEVARLLDDESGPVRATHAKVVLDADGWAHLERFIRAAPSDDDLGTVAAAARRLLRALPTGIEDEPRVDRRVLWYLLANDALDVARQFVAAVADTASVQQLEEGLAVTWAQVLATVRAPSAGQQFSIDVGRLVNDGPLTLLVNRAENTPVPVLQAVVNRLRPQVVEVSGRTALLSSTVEALRRADPVLMRRLSAARHLAPLVVDTASSSSDQLVVSGPISHAAPDGARVALVARGARGVDKPFPLSFSGRRWHLVLENESLELGRSVFTFRVTFDGQSVDFPVVTARMPLPPVTGREQLQPLADRANGWRFIVDRSVRRPWPIRWARRAAGIVAPSRRQTETG